MAKSKNDAESHFRRFEKMLKEIVSVPKSEIDKRETAYKKKRAKGRKKHVQI